MYYSWRYNATGYNRKTHSYYKRRCHYNGPWRIERGPLFVPLPTTPAFQPAWAAGSTWVVPPIHIGSDR